MKKRPLDLDKFQTERSFFYFMFYQMVVMIMVIKPSFGFNMGLFC